MTVEVEGKTKIVKSGADEHTVLMVAKDDLTAGDAAKRASVNSIGIEKTKQTANVFSLLKEKGIHTAFQRQVDERTLQCHACDMLPIEFVVRRYAWGSYLKRNPRAKNEDGTPVRFNTPVVELFYKHSVVLPPLTDEPEQMEEHVARNLYADSGRWDNNVYTDPFIRIQAGGWELHSAKHPVGERKLMTLPKHLLSEEQLQNAIGQIVLPTFLALEEAWAQVETQYGPVALVDMKMELGHRRDDEELVLADVIDNDSWRIWPGSDPSHQLDKQAFRDGHPLAEVEENYKLVTKLTEQFLHKEKAA